MRVQQLSKLYRHTKKNAYIHKCTTGLRTYGFKRTVYGSTWMEKNCFIFPFFNFLQRNSAETVNCIVLHIHTLVKADTHTKKLTEHTNQKQDYMLAEHPR